MALAQVQQEGQGQGWQLPGPGEGEPCLRPCRRLPSEPALHFPGIRWLRLSLAQRLEDEPLACGMNCHRAAGRGWREHLRMRSEDKTCLLRPGPG